MLDLRLFKGMPRSRKLLPPALFGKRQRHHEISSDFVGVAFLLCVLLWASLFENAMMQQLGVHGFHQVQAMVFLYTWQGLRFEPLMYIYMKRCRKKVLGRGRGCSCQSRTGLIAPISVMASGRQVGGHPDIFRRSTVQTCTNCRLNYDSDSCPQNRPACSASCLLGERRPFKAEPCDKCSGSQNFGAAPYEAKPGKQRIRYHPKPAFCSSPSCLVTAQYDFNNQALALKQNQLPEVQALPDQTPQRKKV